MDKVALIKLFVQQVRQQGACSQDSFEAGWESGITQATREILAFMEELER